MQQLTFSLIMLYSVTMALSRNMAKNKAFILILDLNEQWDETSFTTHLTSASCAKSFGAGIKMLCLFAYSAVTDVLTSSFNIDSSRIFDIDSSFDIASLQNIHGRT